MDNFIVDATLYREAENNVHTTVRHLQNISRMVDSVSTNFPRGFEYRNEVLENCDKIMRVKSYMDDFKSLVEQARIRLAEIDKSFASTTVSITQVEETNAPDVVDNADVDEKKWYESLWDAVRDTGAAWGKGVTSLINDRGALDLLDAIGQTGATIFIAASSVLSGASKVGEGIIDGVTFLGGALAAGAAGVYDIFAGTDYAAKTMDGVLDFIGQDLIGEANQWFYENSTVGKAINAKSNLKYDSEGAQAVQKGSEFVAKVAAATAATVLSGGIAAPLVLGALYGIGAAEEKYTQSVDRDNDEEYNYLKAGAKGAVAGLTGALEWWGYGKLGSAVFQAGKTLSIAGAGGARFSVKAITSNVVNYLKTMSRQEAKAFGQRFAQNFLSVDNILETAATVADHGVNWAFGDETTEELLKYGGLELGISIGLNALGATYSAVNEGVTARMQAKPSTITIYPEDEMTAFKIAQSEDPYARAFRNYDEYSKYYASQRRAWKRDVLQKIQYTDPVSGRSFNGYSLIEGYTMEIDRNPGCYYLVNTVARAEGDLSKLVDANGERLRLISTTGPKYHRINDINGVPTIRCMGLDGGDLTFSQVIDRANNEALALNKILNANTLSEDLIVGRGTDYSALAKYGITPNDSAQEIVSKLSGKVFSDPAFLSATSELNAGFMENSEVNFIFTVNKGTGMGDFSEMWNAHTEKEVLLPMGLKFEPYGVQHRVDGKLLVFLKQIGIK